MIGSRNVERPWSGAGAAAYTRDIYRRFGGKLALTCFVIEGGEISVGDEVHMLRGRACAGSDSAPSSRNSFGSVRSPRLHAH